MPTPQKVLDLIELFTRNADDYHSTDFNEAQTRQQFILDPACGSASVLLGAYQYLLDWHLDQYTKDGPEKHKKELFPLPGGGFRLTTAERNLRAQ